MDETLEILILVTLDVSRHKSDITMGVVTVRLDTVTLNSYSPH